MAKTSNAVFFILIPATCILIQCTNSLNKSTSKNENVEKRTRIDTLNQHKKKDSSLVENCIDYPKSPRFLNILKKTVCVQLPFEINLTEKNKPDVTFDSADSAFFANNFKDKNTKSVDTILNGRDGILDDMYGINNNGTKPLKFIPVSLIYDSKDFVLLTITNNSKYGSPFTMVCSFTKDGSLIDGFLGHFSEGRGGSNQFRNTVINKDLTVNIVEEVDNYGSGDNSALFKATWQFLKTGKLIKLRQKVHYGKDYDFNQEK
jgi:hypothetical protein